MKFELKEEYIQKGETGKPSFVILPSGICEVLINTAGAPVTKNCICNFTKETKINCVLIDVGFIGIYVCGDILITLKEMGYDLASKDDWKRAKKQDREKIVAEYEKLASEQPELFDASKVDTSQLSQVIEKSGAEAATASEEKDTNTDASSEKVDKDKNITVKDLKFPLLESYFTYERSMGMNVVSQIILPSGKYETKSIFNGITYFHSSVFDCDITGISASKNNKLFQFSVSAFGDVRVCGDILITLIEMDKYDFRNKKETKKIKGDKDYILENYFRLLEEKPELFDASKIDLKKIKQNKKKAAAKKKPATKKKAAAKKKNIRVKDLKFPLLESYFTYETSMGMNVVTQIIFPSGKYETESIFDGLTYFVSSGLKCDITGISASKNNNIFHFKVGPFVGVYVCGDILITLIEMDKYDFRNKKETKKIKGDKDYILENYFRLLEEKPELFDASKIDFEKMEQETKRADAKAVKESLKIDYDKFNNKKTITSNSSIRHDMTDLFAGISTAMKSYTNILDVVSSAVQYLTLTPRYVETPNMGSLVIDLHYTGNDWIFFENGNLIFMADDTNYTFPPEGKTSDVHGGGKVDENLYYFIPINDYKSIAKSTKVEIQVSGRSIKVEFALEEKDISILDNFYTGVFEGDDPLVDIKSVQTTKEAAPQEKQQEQSQPKQVDIKSELKKYKEMLDDGLITQEDFDAKKKELLGL
jgi:hypothetical protein